MFKYDVDIYDLCSSTERKAIELFCQKINSSNADIFIILSNKAYRLFQLLIDQNHISVKIANKTIVSENSLEYAGDYFQCKQIVLINDSPLIYTAISSIRDWLRLKGASNTISLITIATEEEHFNINCANEKTENTLFCNKNIDYCCCAAISKTISNILSFYGISPETEFPNYNVIEFTDKESDLFNNKFWYINHIPEGNKGSEDIRIYSILPRECVKTELWARIKCNIDSCTHLKLMVYAKTNSDGIKECDIVPMCLFDEITETEVDILYNKLKPKSRELLIESNNEYMAKIHYLQFYISHKLFLIFNDLYSKPFHPYPTSECIKYIFGINNYEIISKAIMEYPVQ